MAKTLSKGQDKRETNSFFRGLEALPVEVQDRVIDKIQAEQILEYKDRNRERVFRFCCMVLFVGVFIFATLRIANLSQQVFVWVLLGILVLSLVVLGAKDLLRKYLPPH